MNFKNIVQIIIIALFGCLISTSIAKENVISKDSKVIKYASDPNGMIVATIKATVNKEI